VAQHDSWPVGSVLGGIDYTSHLMTLMIDIVRRVPELAFIDLDRVLVFARPGRSSADGPFASCHSLGLPPSEPGYYFWRDVATGAVTRRTEWFVTKSPRVYRAGQLANYLISVALPRFPDQALSRSQKRVFYPAGTPDWVARLDTVVHELYHIDPDQTCLRRFRREDGTVLDALHSPTYFQDVARLVQQYLETRPEPATLEFLNYDFAGLRARYGSVVATTFRAFPSYPRRYREVVHDHPVPEDLRAVPVHKLDEPVAITVFLDGDLQQREFFGHGSRLLAPFAPSVAA
jgi:hypothetical protein